jgi:hypothetical protein
MEGGSQQKGVPSRRGRPPLPAGQGKRYALGIRTTKELKDRLAQASAVSGRSVAQEIESRLEQSLAFSNDPHEQRILRALSEKMRPIVEKHFYSWFHDPELRGAAFRNCKDYFEETHASMLQRDLYDKLINQIKIVAQKDNQIAQLLAKLHCQEFVGYASQSSREKYYDAVREITGLSSADLDREIDAAADAERETMS